jgi:phosphotriesterase-related protein
MEECMATIQSVRGPIDSEELGLTLVHEHVIFQFDDSKRKAAVEFEKKLLQDACNVGIKTMVELTPVRRIDWLMELNNHVDLNIVASTGYYLDRMTPGPLAAYSEAQMIARMVREITEGIDGTDVKAGIIKVAGNLPELTPWEVQVFTAVAKVQQKTGVCIATHACAGSREQADVLLRAGADLNRAFFSHVEAEFGWQGRTVKEEARYLEDIARKGGSLLFNNFAFEWDTPWPDLTYLLHYLCDAGLQEKILISMDVNWTWNQKGEIEFEAQVAHPGAEKRVYAFMVTNVVPALLGAGFTEKDVNQFLVGNPRKFFARSGQPM